MSDTHIIAVKPTEKYFSLQWLVGTRCNYDCMYCSTAWHDDHSQHHSLDKLKEAWIKMYQQTHHLGLAYKISFSGGELTTNKNFFTVLGMVAQQLQSLYF